MCGIVGAVAQRNVVPILIEGLRKLEYRGYDSAGLALLDPEGHMNRVRAVGRVAELDTRAKEKHADAPTGIAHTRWATHGGVNEGNAHPHISTGSDLQISVVHNGIIENHEELRSALKAKGYEFTSQTDTEVVAHLVHSLVLGGLSLTDAVAKAIKQLHGAYALAVISSREPGTVVGTRRGSPLLLGVGGEGSGKGENFLASDTSALLQVTKHVIYLEEGDLATLTCNGYTIRDAAGNVVTRPVVESQLSADAVELGNYDHYMQKEIFEQPGAIGNTLEMIEYASSLQPGLFGAEAEEIFKRTRRILILACGTSYHAGMVAKYWLESIARIPTDVEIASEYRYRDPVPQDETLVITISQSGETADTLAALQHAKGNGMTDTLSICNVPESALIRNSKLRFLTRAGPEIGVASTKAFLAQITACYLLGLYLAQLRGNKWPDEVAEYLDNLAAMPDRIQHVLDHEETRVRELGTELADKSSFLFLGRHVGFPVALEGALKLKELAYVHAEGFAAGELKHGPIALIEEGLPVFVIVPTPRRPVLHDKVISNIQEIRARGARTIVIAEEGDTDVEPFADHIIRMPVTPTILWPLLTVVPLQIFAAALTGAKGLDIDQPRNLAKSVTVE